MRYKEVFCVLFTVDNRVVSGPEKVAAAASAYLGLTVHPANDSGVERPLERGLEVIGNIGVAFAAFSISQPVLFMLVLCRGCGGG